MIMNKWFHQQRPFLFVLVGFLLLLWASLLSEAPLALAAHARQQQAQAIQLQEVTMITQHTGWAVDKNRTCVLYTTQGPMHWTNITPPHLNLPGNDALNAITAYAFLDATHGYLGVLQNGATTLLMTSNSGKTWQSVPFTFSPLSAVSIYQIAFLNATHGWLAFLEDEAIGGNIAIALESTSDGGKTWQRLVDDYQGIDGGLPIKDFKSFTFTSSTIGWMTGPEDFAPTIRLYGTQDGGNTWSLASVAPVQPVLFTQSFGPYFDSAQKYGTLPVVYELQGDTHVRLTIYRTSDGGKTWYVVQNAGSSVALYADYFLTFRTQKEGWLLELDPTTNQPLLYRTQDAGIHWNVLHPIGLQAFNGVVLSLQFLTSTTGWLVTNDDSGTTHFMQTNDAGQHWLVVYPLLNN